MRESGSPGHPVLLCTLSLDKRKNTNTVTHRTTGSSGRWASLGNAAPSSRHTSSLYTCAVAARPLRVTPHSGHGCGIVADSSAVEPTTKRKTKNKKRLIRLTQGRGFFLGSPWLVDCSCPFSGAANLNLLCITSKHHKAKATVEQDSRSTSCYYHEFDY
jgi:hypothetical protein